jgi:hypothetical protein
MAWKLRTLDQTVMPFLESGKDTRMTRLTQRAIFSTMSKFCALKGPDGEQIELPELEKWCASTGRKAP